MTQAIVDHGTSERSTCKLAGQSRSTQRREPISIEDEPRLLADMHRLSAAHPRYGYRRIHQMLLHTGWRVNHKRVQRLWRRDGMSVPRKRRKRRRLGDSSNSCVLHKATAKNHVWSYDFVFDRTEDSRQLKIPALIDEFTREDLCTHVAHSITGDDLVTILAGVMETRGCPENIRSDNGPEFAAHAVRNWLTSVERHLEATKASWQKLMEFLLKRAGEPDDHCANPELRALLERDGIWPAEGNFPLPRRTRVA